MNGPVEPPVYADNVRPLPQRGTSFEPQRGTSFEPQRGTSFEPQRASYDSQRGTHDPHPQEAAEAYRQRDMDQPFEPANSNTAQSGRQVADVLPFTPPAVARPGPQYNPRGAGPAGNAAMATLYDPLPVAIAEPMQSIVSPPAVAPVASVEVPDWQREIGIVMTRVTESITVPLSSEARLPQALFAAARAATTGAPAPVEATAETVEPPRIVGLSPAAGEDFDTTVTDFARRYVRGPAE